MIAPLELVKGMALSPNACVLCANNPVDEITGEQLEHVFAPGVDVNWGNSVYICDSCCQIIADLKGRVTVAGFDKLKEENKELSKANVDLKGKLEKAQGFLDRITDGKAAVKQIKNEAGKSKKKVKT